MARACWRTGTRVRGWGAGLGRRRMCARTDLHGHCKALCWQQDSFVQKQRCLRRRLRRPRTGGAPMPLGKLLAHLAKSPPTMQPAASAQCWRRVWVGCTSSTPRRPQQRPSTPVCRAPRQARMGRQRCMWRCTTPACQTPGLRLLSLRCALSLDHHACQCSQHPSVNARLASLVWPAHAAGQPRTQTQTSACPTRSALLCSRGARCGTFCIRRVCCV